MTYVKCCQTIGRVPLCCSGAVCWISVGLRQTCAKVSAGNLSISGQGMVRIFLDSAQTSVSGSVGEGQCVAGISTDSRKILTGFQWFSVEFRWILGRIFAVCRCRGSKVMGCDAAYWWESVLGLWEHCGVLWVSCGNCLGWVWGSEVVGQLCLKKRSPVLRRKLCER